MVSKHKQIYISDQDFTKSEEVYAIDICNSIQTIRNWTIDIFTCHKGKQIIFI